MVGVYRPIPVNCERYNFLEYYESMSIELTLELTRYFLSGK